MVDEYISLVLRDTENWDGLLNGVLKSPRENLKESGRGLLLSILLVKTSSGHPLRRSVVLPSEFIPE